MQVRQIPVFLLAAFFAAILAAYMVAQIVVQKFVTGGKVSVANECAAASASEQGNQNKALFVSCGGFIE